MIRKHAIIGDNVILFLDFESEIGSFEIQNKTFKEWMVDYIREKNIEIFGKKIFLVFGGVLVATFVYFNNDINLYSMDNDYTYTSYFSALDNLPIIEEAAVNKSETIIEDKNNETTIEDKNMLDKDNISKSNTSKSTTSKNFNTATSSSKSSNSNVTTNNKNNNTSNKSGDTISNSFDAKTKNIKNTVTVYRNSESILELGLEEYVLGVVAAEMPASFNIEALKAQAILARTYALKSKQNGKKLTDTVSTQAYIDVGQMKNKWGNDYLKYYNKIKKAVETTKGMYITYDGSIIDAVYHSTSNGYTEDALNVWGYSLPYLKTVESSWDKNTSSYKKVKEFKIEDFLNFLRISSFENIEIIDRNVSGRVNTIKVGDSIYNGVDFRNLLSLRSTDFDIEINDDVIRITTRGYGHGVGMSQYGANEMAKKGYTYSNIINYYYLGVKISNL